MCNLPSVSMLETGANITRLRRRANLSVQQLQFIFGFSSPQAIYKWQRGESLPTIDNLVVLAAVFQTTIDEIIVLSSAESISRTA